MAKKKRLRAKRSLKADRAKRGQWASEMSEDDWDELVATMHAEISEDLQVWQAWMIENLREHLEEKWG